MLNLRDTEGGRQILTADGFTGESILLDWVCVAHLIKSFTGNYPLTICEITDEGVNAYEIYVNAINDYFRQYRKDK